MEAESKQSGTTTTNWTATQTYAMAAVCLLIGVLVGYLVRGSAKPAAQASPASAEMQQAATTPPSAAGQQQQKMPTLDDMKRMADKQADPLLAKLKTDPKNVDLLNQIALTYKATHQFKEAVAYFQKALDVDPKNVPIRTDMASCMYYTGDVDGALAELDKSLTYDPKHPGTLMNIGIIKWRGKNDVNGAVAAWEKLLKLNPNFPQKAVIEQLITQAQQQKNTAQSSTQPKG
ncbi:MAG: tetratricopeptide repeat protein [Candidatus Korobacteraceae bacterium]|jgi:cytochrome c-type biogenesis protein CcmH/NrfG